MWLNSDVFGLQHNEGKHHAIKALDILLDKAWTPVLPRSTVRKTR